MSTPTETTTRVNPILDLFEKYEACPNPPANPLHFLECITAWVNETEWPVVDYGIDIEDTLDEHRIRRYHPLVAEARADLAQRALAVSKNPILVAFRWEPDGGWQPGSLPLAAQANDLLNALGGPGPDFDFDLYESASAESQIDAQRHKYEWQIDEARVVAAGLTLVK